MAEDKAQRWLDNHPFSLPAVDVLQQQAQKVLRGRLSSLAELADAIALDPGMTVSLFHQVNSQLVRSGRHPVGNVHSALGLLGEGARADLILQHKTINDTIKDESVQRSYYQLISRNYNLLEQLRYFISLEGIHDYHEVLNAGVLHNIGEFCACLHDPELYARYQREFYRQGSEINSAKAVFGFDFQDLGTVLCRHLHLGELVTESMHLSKAATRKAHLVQLAADISHQAEKSWYSDSMRATQEVCSAYLSLSLEHLEKECHQAALKAARECPLPDVLSAAARLIMLPDVEGAEVPLDIKQEAPKQLSFEDRIREVLKKPDVSQAAVINELLDYLHDDSHLSRVVMMILSKDRKSVGVKATRGLDEQSPIQRQVLRMAKNTLFQSIMKKPAAVWIETGNFQKFERMLSDAFKAGFLTENFFLMSLFLGERPVALVFGDRSHAVNPLDKNTYQVFKNSVLLASKALNVVAKRNAVRK